MKPGGRAGAEQALTGALACGPVWPASAAVANPTAFLVAVDHAGLVVAVGVEGQLAQELAGAGVDDADVQVLDQEQDAGSGVGPPGADVVEPAVTAEGDGPGGVGAVGADAVVGAG